MQRDDDLPEAGRKHGDMNISQKSLATFINNSDVTHVPECGVYIVKAYNDRIKLCDIKS